jgi:hypothetical protein
MELKMETKSAIKNEKSPALLLVKPALFVLTTILLVALLSLI